MNSGGTLRRIALGLVTAAVLGTGSAAFAATAAQAEEQPDAGLATAGQARYVVSDQGRPVQVEQLLVLTNVSGPGSGISRYPLWLPDGASGLKATSDGSRLSVSVDRSSGEQFARIALPRSLARGRSVAIRVTYSIKGAAPRSKERVRLGKGYAAFDVFSPGDPGRASIQVVAPRAMDTAIGLPSDWSDDGDTRTTVATGGGPFGMWSRASLRDPDQSATSTVKVGTESFEIVGFPGDSAWSRHIAAKLPATISALERVAGQKWPSQLTTVTEDLSGEVFGWDGSYDKGDIRVSEALDPALLAHELSHAFASYDNLEERWLTEGLAQELATEISAVTKLPDRPHPTVRPGQVGSFPLSQWPGNFGVATTAEAYGYPASWHAVHALMAASTPAVRPALVRALTTKATVYDAPGEVTIAANPTTWRQAYDLFEVMGSNRETRAIMTKWVIGSADAQAVSARAAARKAYTAQERLDGQWSQPRGVRTPMTDWDFRAATAAMAQVRDLAGPAVLAQQTAARAGLGTTKLRTAYQAADDEYDYQQVAAQLAAYLGQARAYEQVRSDLAAAGTLTRLGARIVPVDSQLATAKSQIEALQFTDAESTLASTTDRLGTATLVGRAVVVCGLLVLLVIVLTAALAWRRHSRRQPVAVHRVGLPEPAEPLY